uniref:Serine protease family S10 putative n=1 Tax=Albugo laibachii Nc14 TaxID=890382 RepID=F0WX44_9STRA|nr:serine protease family S10 putative [Albugo laibachii Nc14]|eukprot:CCA26034.1 serine protease family S10 putative [Albugo laibachii Nc14]
MRLWQVFASVSIITIHAARITPPSNKHFLSQNHPSEPTELSTEISKATSDRIETLPGLNEDIVVDHHAGLITLDSGVNDRLFYWHFNAYKSPEKAPLIIWLNGGPGCSSMEGLFYGISPFYLDKGEGIRTNPHSWLNTANMLFLDQPVGTGMSSTHKNEHRVDEETLAKDFREFLIKFLKLHPEYLSLSSDKPAISRPIYIFGESHAGRYIPQFSQHILEQNLDTKDIHISLHGVGIGNGWVHPIIQYDYSEFAHGIGLITLGQVRELKAIYAKCIADLNISFYSRTCLDNIDTIIDSVSNSRVNRLNQYDVRMFMESSQEYPAGLNHMTEYLNRLDVRKALHANTDQSFRYNQCSSRVHTSLLKFDGVSSLKNVDFLLENGVQVLFYNGQWDMVCNPYNTEKLLLFLEWKGSQEFHGSEKFTWMVKGQQEPAGYAQHGGNLTYLVVAGAGHMVTYNVPAVALDMVDRFIHGKGFADQKQSVASIYTNSSHLASYQCPSVEDLQAVSALFHSGKSFATALWIWIVILMTLLSAAISSIATASCMRSRISQGLEHCVLLDQDENELLKDQTVEVGAMAGDTKEPM